MFPVTLPHAALQVSHPPLPMTSHHALTFTRASGMLPFAPVPPSFSHPGHDCEAPCNDRPDGQVHTRIGVGVGNQLHQPEDCHVHQRDRLPVNLV